jgi:LruC domain-containing protein/choice-of-anchor A domain-containing protein
MKTTLTRLLTAQGITKTSLTAILFSLGQLANAQQSPTAPALGFNVFVKNAATLSTNETDGPIAIGGDLTLKGNYVIAAQSAGTFKVGTTNIGLLIGGRINYTSGNQFYVNNGYVKLGNATGSTVHYKDNNGANSNLRITSGRYDANPSINLQTSAANLGVSATVNPVVQAGLIDFAKAFSTMQANSKIMAAMSTNIEFTNPNGDRKGSTLASVLTSGQVKVNLKDGVNVINTNAKEINTVDIITFNTTPNAKRILVININAEGTFNWKVWNQAGLGLQNCPYIIYNFYNTTNLQIQGNSTVEGTVFAPLADITKNVNQSNIEGQVIGLSYLHSGGENHYANFNASFGEPDADGDGVPDAKDEYPNDNTKAFNNPYPAKGTSTLMYEDLWPFKGDYDFNDLVIDFRFNTVTDASNNVAQIEYKFIPKASGAVTKNAFAFQLDGINSSKIVSVTGSKMAKGWSALNSNGTEAGHSANANIIVFDYANTVFNGSAPAGSVVNTFMNSSFHTADTITVVVKFQTGGVSFTSLNSAKFNPYLIVDQTRGREVHLPNRMPTAKMDASYFGKGNDNSNPATGKYFKTKNNLPWALEIATSIPYAQEMVEFSKAYPNFIKWAESNGTTNTDWYLNNAGNRDASKLYNK